MTHAAKILADSLSPDGVRLTTFEITFPRIILAEFNTHRMFCLAGDSELEFDLPSGNHADPEGRRVYRMRIDEFVDKWLRGARRYAANPKRENDLSWIEAGAEYPAQEVASRLGMANASNINQLCRKGVLQAKRSKDGRAWMILGESVAAWRRSSPEHTRFDIRSRLAGMRIRQLNEKTGDIQWSHVANVCESGEKEVFEVIAGDFHVAGSADHLVLTVDRGWMRIGDLDANDKIVVRKFGKQEDEKLDPLRLKKIDGVWRCAWQREIRAQMQDVDPKCRRCRIELGQHIHHVVPVYQRPDLAFVSSNVTLLCKPCHDVMHEEQDWQGGTYLYGAAVPVEDVVLRGVEKTYDLEIAGEWPNFLANGVVVHNSRNSASSRAIPVKKMLEMVRTNPYIPTHWGKNEKGMSASEEVDEQGKFMAISTWLRARDHAAAMAEHLAVDLDIHKQTANRLLEPFMWHTCIVTATEWSNYFHLRDNAQAHPEIQKIAHMMRSLHETTKPDPVPYGAWHLPLVPLTERFDLNNGQVDWSKVSVGRCARVSYLTHDGKRDPQADVELHDRLLKSGHMSPFEHVARPMVPEDWSRPPTRMNIVAPITVLSVKDALCGNFRSWVQYRKTILGEADILGAH